MRYKRSHETAPGAVRPGDGWTPNGTRLHPPAAALHAVLPAHVPAHVQSHELPSRGAKPLQHRRKSRLRVDSRRRHVYSGDRIEREALMFTIRVFVCQCLLVFTSCGDKSVRI